jgi:DNA-binding response OmpR family regulator
MNASTIAGANAEIPIMTPAIAPALRPPRDRTPGRGTATGAWPPRILVIAHREEDGALVRRALTPFEARIEQVSKEQAAWERLMARPYDLLVVLLPLLETDALALCRGLRAAYAWRPIMLIATTRLAAADAPVLEVFEAGADAYLVAPIHAGELRARIGALLRRCGVALYPMAAEP